MKNKIRTIKRKLDDSISQLCDVSWMFSSNPEKDFSRDRKLPLKKVISILLSVQGGTLTTELLKYFNCLADKIKLLSLRFRKIIFLYDSDTTGIKESKSRVEEYNGNYNVFRLELPLSGTKQEKDISDYFALGRTTQDLQKLINKM
mgnify:CR=1 FL=1